jgi:hypothetical protein
MPSQKNKLSKLLDPGCEKATQCFDEINRIPEDQRTEDLFAFAMIVETHKQGSQPHSPDCFMNRKIN